MIAKLNAWRVGHLCRKRDVELYSSSTNVLVAEINTTSMCEGKELLLFLDIKSHRNADDGIIFADSSFYVLCLFCKRLKTHWHIFVRYFSILVKRKPVNKRKESWVPMCHLNMSWMPANCPVLFCVFFLFSWSDCHFAFFSFVHYQWCILSAPVFVLL